MKSWRTTTLGVLGAVLILIVQAIALLDSDPTTQISIEAITAAVTVLGIGTVARDNSVTSEDAGAT